MTEYKEGGELTEESAVETVDNIAGFIGKKEENPAEEPLTPVTALLVVLLPNGNVEVSTELSGFNMTRKATMRDAINLCESAASDLKISVIAKTVAKELQIQAQQHAIQRQMQQVTKEVTRTKR